MKQLRIFSKAINWPVSPSVPGLAFWERQKIVLNKEVPLLNQVLPIILSDVTFFYLTAPFQRHCGFHSVLQTQNAKSGSRLPEQDVQYHRWNYRSVFCLQPIGDAHEWFWMNGPSLNVEWYRIASGTKLGVNKQIIYIKFLTLLSHKVPASKSS